MGGALTSGQEADGDGGSGRGGGQGSSGGSSGSTAGVAADPLMDVPTKIILTGHKVRHFWCFWEAIEDCYRAWVCFYFCIWFFVT